LQSFIQNLSDKSNQAARVLLLLVTLTMIIVMGLQVFCRYVLNNSLFWSEELGRICLVWLTFLGSTIAYKQKAHFGIEFLFKKFSKTIQNILNKTVLTLSFLFFLFLIFYGFQFSIFIKNQLTPALGISKQLPFLIIPISGIILAIHALNFFAKDCKTHDC